VKLAFRKELTKFENLSTRAEDEEAAMVEDAEP